MNTDLIPHALATFTEETSMALTLYRHEGEVWIAAESLFRLAGGHGAPSEDFLEALDALHAGGKAQRIEVGGEVYYRTV